MKEIEMTQTVRLRLDANGTIRIADTRVTLDSVVGEFKDGATAEEIQDAFPVLTLRDVYSAISYYMEYTETVEEYLREQKQAAQEIRQQIESQLPTDELRARIRARRSQLTSV